MQIENSTIKDIDEIFRLYRIATEYQRAKKAVESGLNSIGNLWKPKLPKIVNGK